jgi:CofD-related protein of GAK system
VLFFSGGSALNDTSRALKYYTHNSIHLVTPFDSGGSSAQLRRAFNMPAIGDLRSRLIALADEAVTGHPEVYRLFTYRLPLDQDRDSLCNRLRDMIDGHDEMVSAISNPMRRLIRNQLVYFQKTMPNDFDLRGASIGNLILAGGYLNNHRHLDPIIFLFTKLVSVLGTVRAIVNKNLHLAVELDNGDCVVGQHRITGKEVRPLESPIANLMLSSDPDRYQPAKVEIRKKTRKLIQKAELICYAPGSFYSSLVANLLPGGVTEAIRQNDCPKVFVPGLGVDPERLGMTLEDSVAKLLHYLHRNCADTDDSNLLGYVLLDTKNGDYGPGATLKSIQKRGVQIIETRLLSSRGAGRYDPELLAQALLSLT